MKKLILRREFVFGDYNGPQVVSTLNVRGKHAQTQRRKNNV